MSEKFLTKSITYDNFKKEVLNDYRTILVSREASLIGRKEVLSGKAKFGIFGDGKELPQIAMAKVFEKGDFRSGYYRDQTFMLAIGGYFILKEKINISTEEFQDKFWKSKSLIPYDEELTVFINVNTASLNEYSKLISLKDKKIVNEKSEIIKITIVRKYLFISLVAKLILENTSLFINTFFGLLKESI